MKLSGARADNFLKSPPADNIGTLLFGPDQGLSAERAAALIQILAANPDDPFSVTVLSADDLANDPARLADEMSALSLLGDARLIRVRLSHERSGAALAKIIKALDARPDTCAAKLIIEAGDMMPRSPVRKAFEAAKNFTAIPGYADSVEALARLVKNDLAAFGLRIEQAALDAFVPLLKGDRRLARTEIEKMALYKDLGKAEDILVTRADIKALAAGAGSAGLDEIVFAALGGDTLATDNSYRRAVAGKISAPAVLAALQRHLTRLHQAAALIGNGQSADEAMRALRPPVFMMDKAKVGLQLRLWPEKVLARALTQSLDVERQIKTTGAPAEALMGRLLLALAGFAAKRRRV